LLYEVPPEPSDTSATPQNRKAGKEVEIFWKNIQERFNKIVETKRQSFTASPSNVTGKIPKSKEEEKKK